MGQISHLPWAMAGIFTRDIRSVVGRAIVDEQQLPLGVILRQHALDGFAQERRSIQEDGDDGYQTRSTRGWGGGIATMGSGHGTAPFACDCSSVMQRLSRRAR